MNNICSLAYNSITTIIVIKNLFIQFIKYKFIYNLQFFNYMFSILKSKYISKSMILSISFVIMFNILIQTRERRNIIILYIVII